MLFWSCFLIPFYHHDSRNVLPDQYSLYINCGGKEAIVNGTKYAADVEPRGASMLYLGQNWAFSSTGNFMDNDVDADNYIATNTSKLSMPDWELYTTARLSPLSLTYYGLCLINGNYTVKLHFAEIIFTNDSTFTSLGRRIFNVFIQVIEILTKFFFPVIVLYHVEPILNPFNAGKTCNDGFQHRRCCWCDREGNYKDFYNSCNQSHSGDSSILGWKRNNKHSC